VVGGPEVASGFDLERSIEEPPHGVESRLTGDEQVIDPLVGGIGRIFEIAVVSIVGRPGIERFAFAASYTIE
jgi:hypothetical protein